MRELLAHAARLGVSVHVAHLPEPYNGFYDHENQRVIYDFKLAPIERDCVLAHELAHVYLGHHDRGDETAEAAADAYAAALLIDPERYAQLETIGLNPEEVAEELGVTVKLLRAFVENHLTRVRGAAYTQSRMGAGQFRHAARWAT
ncbi:ImmA/IrrE family metallo-endopeptidase [Microbacterium sp. NPDC007973]|uniref:ImmA/IrrE family metallo-endopeptidase n=1 Tax=Microbacterium sp. NPDC007973 TaxID=3364182 RepID=UPI0036E48BC8